MAIGDIPITKSGHSKLGKGRKLSNLAVFQQESVILTLLSAESRNKIEAIRKIGFFDCLLERLFTLP